jgi:rod shape-determining protein MreC
LSETIQTNKNHLQTITLLQQQCSALQEENTTLKALASYMQDTKDLALFKQTFDHADARIAQIIEWYLTEHEHYIVINVGSSSGIQKNMLVINNNNLVGRVIEVFPWYSKVQLVTDPNICIPAYMIRSNTAGIYQGTGSINYAQLGWVNHLQGVVMDDELLTSGEGLIYPRGYKLGTVISKDVTGLYYNIQIKPAIDPYMLHYCLVFPRTQ